MFRAFAAARSSSPTSVGVIAIIDGHVRRAERRRRERQQRHEQDRPVRRCRHGQRGHRDGPQDVGPDHDHPTVEPIGDHSADRVRAPRRGPAAAQWPPRPILPTPCGRTRTPRGPRCRASRRSGRSSTRGGGRGTPRCEAETAATRSFRWCAPWHTKRVTLSTEAEAPSGALSSRGERAAHRPPPTQGGARWPRLARRPAARRRAAAKKSGAPRRATSPTSPATSRSGRAREERRQEGRPARRAGPRRRPQQPCEGRRPQQPRSVAAVPRHVRHLLGPRRGGPRRCHLPSAGSE